MQIHAIGAETGHGRLSATGRKLLMFPNMRLLIKLSGLASNAPAGMLTKPFWKKESNIVKRRTFRGLMSISLKANPRAGGL